ncbi:MAG: hypothetical protein ACSW8A_08110 [Lachnospiraceae bacterium]
MARVFYPRQSITIPANAPHPEGTEYKISIGDEEWEGVFQTVVKVQMVYNGKIAGRKSPSYPIGTDDWKRVGDAVARLMSDVNGTIEAYEAGEAVLAGKNPAEAAAEAASSLQNGESKPSGNRYNPTLQNIIRIYKKNHEDPNTAFVTNPEESAAAGLRSASSTAQTRGGFNPSQSFVAPEGSPSHRAQRRTYINASRLQEERAAAQAAAEAAAQAAKDAENELDSAAAAAEAVGSDAEAAAAEADKAAADVMQAATIEDAMIASGEMAPEEES